MNSNSSIRELPPGDPELTASIVSHLKSRGLFDKLRRDCLGDVDTKPAYLNLKQRIEGYITKFLSTQTWTPDLNKNHVRDMMRREINESGMLSAGMDHLVDQIVNPKIYQVFTPEVEDGVRQYLGLSSLKDSSAQQPAPEAATDTSILPPQTPALPPPPLPPLPPKSEFSIDETTQDVPGSCSPKPYIEACTPDDTTDSSGPHLMIVTDNSERTEELPANMPFEEAVSADLSVTSAEPVEPVPSETDGAHTPEQTAAAAPELQAVCPSANEDERLPVEDVVESSMPLDVLKPNLLSEIKPIEIDKKDCKIADMTQKEIKSMGKDRKERKQNSGRSRESSSHSSRHESHSKTHSKKGSDMSKSKPHKSSRDGDLTRESRDVAKEKDKHSASRDKGSSSKIEISGSKTDVGKEERSKGHSSQSSRSKESDSRSERKRSDDRRSHHSSKHSHDDKRRHSDKHSREEKSRDRSDSHRSHSESRKDKDKSSTKVSSRQHKSSKSSEKRGESSRKDKDHAKERKHDYSKQNSSDSRDGGSSKRTSSEKTAKPTSQDLFQADDGKPCYVDIPETSVQIYSEMHANSYDNSQLSFQSASQNSSFEVVEHVAQKASEKDILNGASQSKATVDADDADGGDDAQETLSEAYDECSRGSYGALQLVKAKETEILRFTYVTDKSSGSSVIDLQPVDVVFEEQPQTVHDPEPVGEDGAQLENIGQKSGPGVAALLEVPEQMSPLRKHEATRRKITTETNSPEKKRPRWETSDGHESDGAWSDLTVSSVHTSDLSSYDDCISVSSADEELFAMFKGTKKIPLKEIKKMTSSSNEDEERMNRPQVKPPACDRVLQLAVVLERVAEPTPGKEFQQPCTEPHLSSSTEKASRLSSSPSTVTSDGAPEPKMELRRTRKINPKYASEEFSSIFTKGKRPTGTIDLTKHGKERHHEEQSSSRAEPRKISRGGAPDDQRVPVSCDETDQFSDASITERSRRPARRPSGGESQPRSESTSSKRYQSSDLYKPRPVIPSRSRRSRPSPTEQDTPKKEQGRKVCIKAKRGRPPKAGSKAGSSRGKRL